eukprot:m.257306 g.257306  ORF g.257306 m.257306 type:complete len:312 (+) comp26586_c0_seq4:251-1186(+)
MRTSYRVEPSTGETTVYAGSGEAGTNDGPCPIAQFYHPRGIAVDLEGNLVVADQANHLIRLVNTATRAVTTVAGSGEAGFHDGPIGTATFNCPGSVAVDSEGDIIVADYSNLRIRRINLRTQWVTTVAGSGAPGCADGEAAHASFASPNGVAIDSAGNILVADTVNNRICRIDTVTQHVASVTTAVCPRSVTTDSDGSVITVSGNQLFRIAAGSNGVALVAGCVDAGHMDGPSAAATFSDPTSVAVDGQGALLVTDSANRAIRRVVVGEMRGGAPPEPGASEPRTSMPTTEVVDGEHIASVHSPPTTSEVR